MKILIKSKKITMKPLMKKMKPLIQLLIKKEVQNAHPPNLRKEKQHIKSQNQKLKE